VLRWVVALVTLAALLGVEAPASAATPLRITVSAVPATVHVGSLVAVTGQTSPRAAGVRLTVQRIVDRSWVTVGHVKTLPTGRFALSLRAPRSAATWALRVMAPATKPSKARFSPTVHVRVVKAMFTVRATAVDTVVSGKPIVVSGSVAPKAIGSVALQVLSRSVWQTVTTGKLSKASTFSLSSVQPAGSHSLRVVKAYTRTTAAGSSAALSVTVVTPPPSVSTTLLPAGTVGLPYAATLTAAGGVAPYTWSLSGGGLPAGLALSPAGHLSGTPTGAASPTITVVVTDAAGHSGSLPLVLPVALSVAVGNAAAAWGSNSSGQLGNATTTDSNIPVPVRGPGGFVAVTGGGSSGYGLRFDGSLWAWGDNSQGQLGIGSTTNSAVPVQVTSLTGVTAIAGASAAGYALRSDGTVWAYGEDTYGELGNGPGNVGSTVPVQVVGLTRITAIAAGSGGGYALRSDGTVWAWGYGVDGELGNNSITDATSPVQVSGLTGVTSIGAGYASGYAIAAGGTVWSWGGGGSGELGNGGFNSSTTPVQVLGLTGITAVTGGVNTGFALRADHTVVAWGYNHFGELGNGTTVKSAVPVVVTDLTGVTAIAANFSAYALRANGTVWSWGNNLAGSLGNGTSADSSVPVQVSGLTRIVAIGSSDDGEAGYALTGRLPGGG
jgi:alpha-tubulin suppressor-like RCC1 family protein